MRLFFRLRQIPVAIQLAFLEMRTKWTNKLNVWVTVGEIGIIVVCCCCQVNKALWQLTTRLPQTWNQEFALINNSSLHELLSFLFPTRKQIKSQSHMENQTEGENGTIYLQLLTLIDSHNWNGHLIPFKSDGLLFSTLRVTPFSPD